MSNQFRIEKLKHNGVMIPAYEPQGFSIKYRGNTIKLTPEQEEMAVAWAKKLGTDYVKDEVFAKNFGDDFSKAMGLSSAKISDFDFSEIDKWVEAERAKRETMSREEKKKLAEARKEIREENKQKYGYAEVNGLVVEIGNYTVEPPSIFMGRGTHPMRGKWKPRVNYEDITLNLSKDSPTPQTPPGYVWKERVFEPESLWIAKWRDKLTNELKYVWVSDSAFYKQEREIEKFDKARGLEKTIKKVEERIEKHLDSPDPNERKVATAVYLINRFKMRVGDEKDEDEADTVGATTLRGCHVKIEEPSIVEFNFLGKDCVEWRKRENLPPNVVNNLKSFIIGPDDLIFDGINSKMVNEFLGKAVKGLTAKVFRTYHATKAVKDSLAAAKVTRDDTEFRKKYYATLANLKAAETCNHKRKLPKNWEASVEKKKERMKELEARLKTIKEKPKTESLARQIKKLDEKIADAKLRWELAEETKDYNLGTSLKSYIDPRAFVNWANKIGYDWKKYYSKTLQKKYAWADSAEKKCPSGSSD